MIGVNGERESGKSVLAGQHDDDDMIEGRAIKRACDLINQRKFKKVLKKYLKHNVKITTEK